MHRPFVFLCKLVVLLPLVAPPSHPLVVPPSCPLIVLSLHHPLVDSSHRGLLCCLSLHCPLVAFSLRRSHCLAPAGCCNASCCAALLLCRHVVLSSSSHCTALSLSHLICCLLRCLLLHRPLVIFSLRSSLVVLRQLVVALPPIALPSCHAAFLSSHCSLPLTC